MAFPAFADPCEAPVESFHAGQSFSGEVRYVGDGDSICVGRSASPQEWIEVRIADFYAPELRAAGGEAAKATMMRIAKGREVVCTVVRGRNGQTWNHDRVIALCRVSGRSLGDLMRASGVREGGNGW